MVGVKLHSVVDFTPGGDVEQFPAFVNILTYIFVIVYMLSVPLETTSGEIIETLRDRYLMGRALLANFFIVPILGVMLVHMFDLSLEIRTGLLLLALSPGGLLALQFARVSKGNRVLAVALLLVFCLLAILVTPVLTLWFFHRDEGRMPFAWLILMSSLLVVAPLLLGRGLQRLIPEQAPKLGLWLGRLSIVIFIIAAVLAGQYRTPAIKLMGANEIAAMIALILSAWVVGWLLGGPDIKNRKVFAISTSMRNVGVCLPIANHYFAGSEVAVPILAFSGIMIPMNMVFALVAGRLPRRAATSAAAV
jgi:BASS family bile acid:Na+ symporter